MKTMPSLLFQFTLVFTSLLQEASVQSAAPVLKFQASPIKKTFKAGEDIVLRFTLYDNSKDSVFVSRKMYDEFVDLTIFGPDGKEVVRRGKSKIDSKDYSPQDFAVLRENQSVAAESVISLKNGVGFIVDKPGCYRIRAEYSLGPPAYFAPFAGAAKVPEGTFRSKSATFCVQTSAVGNESKQ